MTDCISTFELVFCECKIFTIVIIALIDDARGRDLPDVLSSNHSEWANESNSNGLITRTSAI